jgi:hypothetical protein
VNSHRARVRVIERRDNLNDDDDASVNGAVAMHGGGQHERHMHVPTLGTYVSTFG